MPKSGRRRSGPARGWMTNQHNILNADQGDLAKLYTDGSKTRTTTESNGLTLQSYLLDDILVGTVGWRRDTVKTRSARASSSSITGRVVSLNYQLDPLDPEIGVSKGESKTWGIVLHEPKAWRNKLPLGTRFSLFYDEGNNTRVQSRYSFTGDRLANPKGHTKDYGVVLNTLNDKLRLKITWYDTTVKDATLVGALAGVAQYITNIESVGTAAAMKDLAGIRGDDPGTNWYWNWAWANFDSNNALYGGITGPSSPGYAQWLADPTTVSELAIIKSWQDQMQPQSFWDAYDIPIDTAKVKAGDYMHAIGTWDPTQYVSTIPNTASLMINGVRPTATVDNRSKGIEYEVVAQPISGLTLSVNASKQAASQNALGAAFAAFIEAEYAKFQTPAGDLRMWWAGPGYANTFASWFDQVYASYLFQKQTIGREMPEMAPWRFNGVANYNFEKGALKGFNVGAAVRWDDRTLLGYLLNTTKDNLDVNRPVWASSETHIDLWAGYARKLTAKVDWRIQVNVRNVGESRGLRVLSVQPNDGSPAQYRIVEGATWYVTNTFSF